MGRPRSDFCGTLDTRWVRSRAIVIVASKKLAFETYICVVVEESLRAVLIGLKDMVLALEAMDASAKPR